MLSNVTFICFTSLTLILFGNLIRSVTNDWMDFIFNPYFLLFLLNKASKVLLIVNIYLCYWFHRQTIIVSLLWASKKVKVQMNYLQVRKCKQICWNIIKHVDRQYFSSLEASEKTSQSGLNCLKEREGNRISSSSNTLIDNNCLLAGSFRKNLTLWMNYLKEGECNRICSIVAL